MDEPLLRVDAVERTPDGAAARVSCDPLRLRTRDVAGLAERAFRELPMLCRHRCDNPAGAAVREEMADTEVAHLFEHVAIELLARGAPARGARASTEWDFARDGPGVFLVTVRHPHARAAGRALESAAALMGAWAAGRAGDARGAIAAVRSAAGR